MYIIEHEGSKFLFTLPFESFITEVILGGNAKKTETSTEGMGTIWRFPVDDNLVYLDTNTTLNCQMEQLNLTDAKAIFKKIKETGKIDFERTDLDIRPKPEQYIVFYHDSTQITAKTIWYKDKIEVRSFEFSSEVKCP